MLISVAAPVSNSGSSTLAWEICVQIEKYLLEHKYLPWAEDRVYYVEADMDGGYIGYELGTHAEDRRGMLNVLASPNDYYLQIEKAMWHKDSSTGGKIYALLCEDTSNMQIALEDSETQLASFLSVVNNAFVVADCGAVMHQKRGLVEEANVQIWVVDVGHPGALRRCKRVLEKYSQRGSCEDRFAVLTGPVVSYLEPVQEYLGIPAVAYLPEPGSKLGKETSKSYQAAAAKIMRRALGERMADKKTLRKQKSREKSSEKKKAKQEKAAKTEVDVLKVEKEKKISFDKILASVPFLNKNRNSGD